MTAEQAYEDIASAVLEQVHDIHWSRIEVALSTHEAMIETAVTVWSNGIADYSRAPRSSVARQKLLDAALFLRDDLHKMKGDNISGFTYTLSKDGKVKIDYVYADSSKS
jgi:DNA-binding NtrC family response regulator